MRKSLGATLLTAAWVMGCAGNGDGLNQNGMPIVAGQSGGGPITPDLRSIEDNVFTPICSKCHIGAGAPEGLQLDAAHAYNALVGVPSIEEPSFLRVNPGNPDTSYMLLKIEGAPGIEGGQMPLGETPLPQATIDAIRQWITNGAPNDPDAAAAAATQPFAIQDTMPVHKSLVLAPLARIAVVFNHAVDGSVMNDASYCLERVGDADIDPDHVVSRPGAKIGSSGELAAGNPAVLLITPSDALSPGVYRLSIRGAGRDAVTDLDAETLGGDNSIVFTVEPTP